MPRNVTVTFGDGSSHIYQGVPDDATPEQVTARAQKQFPGLTVTALDGGRKGTPASPKPAPKAISREEAIKQKAREHVARQDRDSLFKEGTFLSGVADFGDAAKATIANTFGIGPRLQAGLSALKDDVSYEDALDFWRAANEAERRKSLGGELTGALVGGGALTKGAGLALKGAATVAPKAANILQKLTTLQRGQTWRNAARMTGVGAATGAAQAAGEGKDVSQGATLGGLFSAGLATAGNLAGSIGSRIANVTQPYSGSVSRGLREVVEESPEALRKSYETMRATTGTDIPLAAALRQPDYDRVVEKVARLTPETAETARQAAKAHINSFPQRMIQHVTEAGDEAARTIGSSMRGADGKPMRLIKTATINELNQVREDVAEEMIEPIRKELVDLTKLGLDDLERDSFLEIGLRQKDLAPRLKKLFPKGKPDTFPGSDFNPITGRVESTGRPDPGSIEATVGELDRLRRALNRASETTRASSPSNSQAYRNAANTIGDLIGDAHPSYQPALKAYAANSRMIEGFETTAAGKRISDVSDTRLAKNLRTPEGRAGMAAGELYRQREAVGASPSSAIRTAREFAARGKLTRQADPTNPLAMQPGTVTENLSPRAAEQLAARSGVEYDALQRSLSASGVNAARATDEMLDNPESLFYGLSLLAPGAMALTRARFFANFVRNIPTGMNPKVAENLTDMLFSADPAKAEQALRALERVGGLKTLGDAIREGARSQVPAATTGILGGSAASPAQQPAAPAPASPEPVPAPQPEANAQFSPAILNLASRMEQVESGGHQAAVSPAGAIGVMQVMPETAPEAAQLAGVPFDEERYRTDEEYNRLLGTAYLAAMLDEFGDETLAVAAYNAGPTAVRQALRKGGDWLSRLPAETQDYVQKVLG